jgi:hypothetical protein
LNLKNSLMLSLAARAGVLNETSALHKLNRRNHSARVGNDQQSARDESPHQIPLAVFLEIIRTMHGSEREMSCSVEIRIKTGHAPS